MATRNSFPKKRLFQLRSAFRAVIGKTIKVVAESLLTVAGPGFAYILFTNCLKRVSTLSNGEDISANLC